MADLTIANTIRQQLIGLGAIKVMSWGANTWVGGNDFLQFKVQGYLFKGWVKIIYNRGVDVYEIDFIKKSGEVVKHIDMVYFDEMVDIIDRYVEKGDISQKAYEQKIKQSYGL